MVALERRPTVIAEPAKKGVLSRNGEPEGIVLAGTTILGIKGKSRQILEILLNPKNQNPNNLGDEINRFYPDYSISGPRSRFKAIVHVLRKKLEKQGLTITSNHPNGRREDGTWQIIDKAGKPVFRKMENKTPPLSHQPKPKIVTVFDGKRISTKPADVTPTPTIKKSPEGNKKPDFDNTTLDLILEKTLPKIGDTISKAMLELIIEAARKNEVPSKADLEKLFEKEGIKSKIKIWELIRRHSGLIRPALRKIGLTINPTNPEFILGSSNDPSRTIISFQLTRIKPNKLASSSEEITSSPVIESPKEKGRS